ncbi:MAG: DUF342 domain-containing protein [bacterium]|nr:DUF342 domain-containing protein [bacterium]
MTTAPTASVDQAKSPAGALSFLLQQAELLLSAAEDAPEEKLQTLKEGVEFMRQMQEWSASLPESRQQESLVSLLQQLAPAFVSASDEATAKNILNQAVCMIGADIEISADKMSAFLFIPSSLGPYWTPETLLQALNDAGVTNGVDIKAVHALLKDKKFDKRVRVARGGPPIAGKDASLVDPMGLMKHVNFVGMEIGTRVDFKEKTFYSAVKKGEILLRKIPADPGKPGADVHGDSIPSIPGVDISFPQNTNCALSKDGLELAAAVDGCAYMNGTTLNVSPSININGNVDYKSGNVKTAVAVQVTGDVLSEFSIASDAEIAVGGIIEGAKVNARQSLLCKRGIEGKDKAFIVSGGDVQCQYIKNATVQAERKIVAQGEIMQSHVKARRVHCEGEDGAIIGGRVLAWEDVCAKTIGSELGVRTEIILGEELPELHEQAGRLEKMLQDKNEQMEKLKEMRKKFPPNASEEDEKFRIFMENYNKTESELQSLEARTSKAKADLHASESALRTVRAEKTIYPGVIIRILGKGMEIRKPTGPTTITFADGKLTPSPYQERVFDDDGEETA